MRTVTTGDGSVTFHSDYYHETYHSTSGALEESQKKFVEPCKISNGMKILDIGFGLGYNVLMALQAAERLEIHSLEKDKALLKELAGLKLPEDLRENYWKVQSVAVHGTYQDEYCQLKLHLGDAKETIRSLSPSFDAVFLDPFSPKKNHELWTAEFLAGIFTQMKQGGILATYSCAGQVRRNLTSVGFKVSDGPIVGRRSPGTVAIKPIIL